MTVRELVKQLLLLLLCVVGSLRPAACMLPSPTAPYFHRPSLEVFSCRQTTCSLQRVSESCPQSILQCWGLYPLRPATLIGGGDPGTNIVDMACNTERGNQCVLRSDGMIRCWGRNGYGELGLGQTNDARFDDFYFDETAWWDFGGGQGATRLWFYGYTGCAGFDDFSIKCWGLNTDRQTGYDDVGNLYRIGDEANEIQSLPEVNLGEDPGVGVVWTDLYDVSINCVVLTNAKVKCWGGTSNPNNKMPVDAVEIDMSTAAMPIQVACVLGASGPAYGCHVLFDDGVVKRFYKVGSGAYTVETQDLGTGQRAVQVEGGQGHICAVLESGDAKCWGSNSRGHLGYEDEVDRGMSANNMGDDLPAINLGTNVSVLSITAGFYMTCASLDNNGVKCWGRSQHEQTETWNIDTDCLGYNILNDEDVGDDANEMSDLGFVPRDLSGCPCGENKEGPDGGPCIPCTVGYFSKGGSPCAECPGGIANKIFSEGCNFTCLDGHHTMLDFQGNESCIRTISPMNLLFQGAPQDVRTGGVIFTNMLKGGTPHLRDIFDQFMVSKGLVSDLQSGVRCFNTSSMPWDICYNITESSKCPIVKI